MNEYGMDAEVRNIAGGWDVILNHVYADQTGDIDRDLAKDHPGAKVFWESRERRAARSLIEGRRRILETAYARMACPQCRRAISEARSILEQIPSTDAEGGASAEPQASGADTPAAGAPAQSGSEPAKEAPEPEQDKGEEDGAPAAFVCPACGAEIPVDDLKRMLGKLLAQIATQLQQGAKTEKEPETGAEEEPETQDQQQPAAQTPAPAQTPQAAAPEEPPKQESRRRFEERVVHFGAPVIKMSVQDWDTLKRGLSVSKDWEVDGILSDEVNAPVWGARSFYDDVYLVVDGTDRDVRDLMAYMADMAPSLKVESVDRISEAGPKAPKGKLIVALGAGPNLDFEPPSRERFIKKGLTYATVRNMKEASRTCQRFIRDNELGGGNWYAGGSGSVMPGDVFDENGEMVGRISYNGRMWSPDEKEVFERRRRAFAARRGSRLSEKADDYKEFPGTSQATYVRALDWATARAKAMRTPYYVYTMGSSYFGDAFPSGQAVLQTRVDPSGVVKDVGTSGAPLMGESAGPAFRPLLGELSKPTETVPEGVEVRIVDVQGDDAFVARGTALHKVPAADVLVYPKGASLGEALAALRSGNVDARQVAKVRLECRSGARRLVDIPEAKVASDAKYVVAYLPDPKAHRKALAEARRYARVSEGPDGTFTAYPDGAAASDAVAKAVEDAGGHVVRSRVAFRYDPDRPLSEQLDSADEADVAKGVNDLFMSAYENLKRARQVFVDVKTAAIQKAIAMLQGEGKGKKTVKALEKLEGKLDIEGQVKGLSKMMEELSKAHDVFVGEFPEVQSEPAPEPAPEPEAPAEPEPQAQPQAPAQEPAQEPAPQAQAAPAAPAAPPQDQQTQQAAERVRESEDWSLFKVLFQEGAAYAKLAQVVKDVVPELDPVGVHKVVHHLTDYS
jgi:hypothetical protein